MLIRIGKIIALVKHYDQFYILPTISIRKSTLIRNETTVSFEDPDPPPQIERMFFLCFSWLIDGIAIRIYTKKEKKQ